MSAIDPPSSAAGGKPGRDSQLFTRKHTSAGGVTSERIEADLAAFREAGGKVEVLGVTHTLKKLDGASAQAATTPVGVSSGARRASKS
jgi:hypothetical protein